MNMTPKIKAAIKAACVILLVLSASIFAYSRMSKKDEQTQAAPAPSATKTETKAKVAVTTTGKIKTAVKIEKTSNETQTLGASKSDSAMTTIFEETSSASANIISTTTLLAPIIDGNDVESDEGEQEEIALAEPIAGTVVFCISSAIFSYDFSSQTKTDISPMSTDGNGEKVRFFYPKPSPDGKVLALNVYTDSNASDVKRGIYVMDMDGSNLRMILELGSMSYDFEFGPDGDSLVYIEDGTKHIRQVFFNSEPRVNRILESVGEFFEAHGFIKWHKGYLYWILYKANNGFEIRRRNMINSLAETEVVYGERESNVIVKYFVSPDGNNLIIARKPSGLAAIYQVIIKNMHDGSETGPLNFEQDTELHGFFSSPDDKWIYASRAGNDPGLVRFRADQIPSSGPIKLELVLPNVDFGYSARFVPQDFQYDNYEQEFKMIPHDKIIINDVPLSAPFTVEMGDFVENLVFSTSSRNAASIVSFDTTARTFKDLSGKTCGLTEEDHRIHVFRAISSYGKMIAFESQNDQHRADSSTFIYLMNADGSDMRRIVQCKGYESFTFGPNDDSILYVEPSSSLMKINLADSSIETIVNRDSWEGESAGFHSVSYVNGHIYWHNCLDADGFEIWRKNLLAEAAKPELVYRSDRILNGYIVSPDGRKLLLLEYECIGNRKYWGTFEINGAGSVQRTRRIVPLIQSKANERYYIGLNHLLWHTDSNGQDWIYAEKSDMDLRGLIRYKVEDFDGNGDFDVVIPEFLSYSGFAFLARNDDVNDYEKSKN